MLCDVVRVESLATAGVHSHKTVEAGLDPGTCFSSCLNTPSGVNSASRRDALAQKGDVSQSRKDAGLQNFEAVKSTVYNLKRNQGNRSVNDGVFGELLHHIFASCGGLNPLVQRPFITTGMCPESLIHRYRLQKWTFRHVKETGFVDVLCTDGRRHLFYGTCWVCCSSDFDDKNGHTPLNIVLKGLEMSGDYEASGHVARGLATSANKPISRSGIDGGIKFSAVEDSMRESCVWGTCLLLHALKLCIPVVAWNSLVALMVQEMFELLSMTETADNVGFSDIENLKSTENKSTIKSHLLWIAFQRILLRSSVLLQECRMQNRKQDAKDCNVLGTASQLEHTESQLEHTLGHTVSQKGRVKTQQERPPKENSNSRYKRKVKIVENKYVAKRRRNSRAPTKGDCDHPEMTSSHICLFSETHDVPKGETTDKCLGVCLGSGMIPQTQQSDYCATQVSVYLSYHQLYFVNICQCPNF